MGPLLFVWYILPLGYTIGKFKGIFYCYADDIQLYFKPDESGKLTAINNWMAKNVFQLDTEKYFIWSDQKHKINALFIFLLRVVVTHLYHLGSNTIIPFFTCLSKSSLDCLQLVQLAQEELPSLPSYQLDTDSPSISGFILRFLFSHIEQCFVRHQHTSWICSILISPVGHLDLPTMAYWLTVPLKWWLRHCGTLFL